MVSADVIARKAQLPLTARELQVMAMSWQCMTEQPKIDFDKLAPMAGITKGSCKEIWRFINAKLSYMVDNPSDGSLNDQNSPSISTPRKGKAAASVTGKTTTGGLKRKLGEAASDDDDDEEHNVKVKNEGHDDEGQKCEEESA